MKKQIAGFALFVMVGAAAFAAAPKFTISVGGGPIFGGSWSESVLDGSKSVGAFAATAEGARLGNPTAIGTLTGIGLNGNGFLDGVADGMKALGINDEMEYKTKSFDIGGFIFGDFTFAELTAAYVYQTGKVYDQKAFGTDVPGTKDYITHNVVIDLLGKYPFALNDRFVIFPALGAGVKLAIGGNDNSDKEHDVLWGLSIKGGVGLDYNINEALYVRCEALFAFQLASDKKATLKEFEGMNNPAVKGAVTRDFTKFEAQNKGYYMGPQLKLAVGYKIKK
ncbi:MAG: hypothetical protein Ta2A_01390 [Treponemataceae bacterium]|nr:MAG: hypothetical protein Ta2A_01390 [Treponemataceae bacterium]